MASGLGSGASEGFTVRQGTPQPGCGLWWPAEGLSGQGSTQGQQVRAQRLLSLEWRVSEVEEGRVPQQFACGSGVACSLVAGTGVCWPRAMRGTPGLVGWGISVRHCARVGAHAHVLTARVQGRPQEQPAGGRGRAWRAPGSRPLHLSVPSDAVHLGVELSPCCRALGMLWWHSARPPLTGLAWG